MEEDFITISDTDDNKDVMVSPNEIENLSLNDNNSYYRILDTITSSGYDINVFKQFIIFINNSFIIHYMNVLIITL